MNDSSAESILALSVHSQHFGFAVFDGPQGLLDWGTKSFRGGVNAVKIPLEAKIMALFDTYRPEIIVMNETKMRKHKELVDRIAKRARRERIRVTFMPWKVVRTMFPEERTNKYRIAAAIAARYPELLPRLPSERKAWQSEQYGIDMFEAMAMGIAYVNFRTATRKE